MGGPRRRRADRGPRPHPGAQLPAHRDAGRARARGDRHRRADGRPPSCAAPRHGRPDPAVAASGRLRPADGRPRRAQPPPLRSRRRPAHDRWRAGVPAGARRGPGRRVGVRARVESATHGLLRAGRAPSRGALGPPDVRERRRGAAPGRRRAAHERPLRRPPGDHRPRARPHGRVHRRPLHATVEREPALGRRVRRLPA